MLSFKKVIKNDYVVFFSLVAIIALIIFTLYFGLTNQEKLLFMTVPLMVISFVLMMYKIIFISNVLKQGVLIKGEIDHIWYVKDRGRLTFSYQYKGVDYQSGIALMKNKYTKDMASGDIIDLYVIANKPKQCIIKALYTKVGD